MCVFEVDFLVLSPLIRGNQGRVGRDLRVGFFAFKKCPVPQFQGDERKKLPRQAV
jgi:hypothetical protein